MHISTNDLHCCKPARLLQRAPSGEIKQKAYHTGGVGGVTGKTRGEGRGSKRLACRNRAAGRFSAPRGETLLLLPPRHSKTFTRARGHWGPRGIGSGCEIHSAREEAGHDTNCIKQEYKKERNALPLESLARGCSGLKFSCAPGPAVQGRSSRAPSPACPRLDLATDAIVRRPSQFFGMRAQLLYTWLGQGRVGVSRTHDTALQLSSSRCETSRCARNALSNAEVWVNTKKSWRAQTARQVATRH